MSTKIRYGTSEEGWLGYEHFIYALIQDRALKRVCEIGGGANPLLDLDQVNRAGLEYSILDISAAELEKAPVGYQKIVADIGSAGFSLQKKFDLVFSRMLAEHIKDARQFHTNVLDILTPGGFAVHFFPTLFTVPYLVNFLVPERLSQKLLNGFAQRDNYQNAKFPAYYKWCRGPVKGQIRKFMSVGFEVVEYAGFYGHPGYYQKIGILKKLHEIKTRYLLKKPNPCFTSYAYVVLKKS